MDEHLESHPFRLSTSYGPSSSLDQGPLAHHASFPRNVGGHLPSPSVSLMTDSMVYRPTENNYVESEETKRRAPLFQKLRYTPEEESLASPEWRRLYAETPLGHLPSRQQCEKWAPASLLVLAKAPFRIALRNTSNQRQVNKRRTDPTNSQSNSDNQPNSENEPNLSNGKEPGSSNGNEINATKKSVITNSIQLFCIENVGGRYFCRVPIVDVDGKEHACTGVFGDSSSGRKNHLTSHHNDLYEAIKRFMEYQQVAHAEEAISQPQAPRNTRLSKFNTKVLNQHFQARTQLNDQDQLTAETLLMRLVAVEGLSFKTVVSKTVRDLCKTLRPEFIFPCEKTLKERLRQRVNDLKGHAREYFHNHIDRGSITTDTWTSLNGRHYLGTSFHFMTPAFQLSSVIIGLERIHSPTQSAVVLHGLVSKCIFFFFLLGLKLVQIKVEKRKE